MRFKLGSLFDGSGGFPLAGTLCGITPAWASEIDGFCVAVTSKRFPNMTHLGDITKINGAEIEPVDVITFGSPCQDLSVANGARKGLEGERSGLFAEAVRIIKEMRNATNGIYPAFTVWENVPGAFSSNKGKDFRTVLEKICRVADGSVSVPEPDGGKWLAAGEIVGNTFSVAWRMLDAQYWGVPQRRKRIFLVADFRGRRAGKILFERESLPGDFEKSLETWKRTAGGIADRAGNADKTAFAAGFTGGQGAKAGSIGYSGELTPTLKAQQKTHVVTVGFNGHKSVSGFYEAETSRTLDHNGGNPTCNQGGIAIVTQNSMTERKDKETPLAFEPSTVCYQKQSYDNLTEDKISGTLKANGGNSGGGSESLVCTGTAAACDFRNYTVNADLSATLQAKPGGGYSLNCTNSVMVANPAAQYAIRRLTPSECAKLQGFPPDYCSDVPHSDSAEYRMWGNGIALPCAVYVLEGIAQELLNAG